jgi:hypothetical protein
MIVLLSILAACVLIAAGVWAVTGWITRDTIVVPDTLGGMAKTTTPLLKVLVTGEADQLHQQLGSDVHSQVAGYGDPTRFALLTVFQNPGGSTESDGSIEDIMAAIISSAGVQDFGNGATMSFGPISAVGDASCAVGTVHANGQSKDAAVLCGRLKGDVAVLVESAPPDTATGAAMVDEAMAAQ